MGAETLILVLWILLAFFVGCILAWFFTGSMIPSSGSSTAPMEPEETAAQQPARAASAMTPSKPATQKPAAASNATKKPAKKAATAKKAAARKPPTKKAAVTKTAGKAPGKPASKAVAKKAAAAKETTPEMLKKPRGGKGDDLKLISGIGPGLEKVLNDMGVWHFDQVAGWKKKDIAWVDERLKFKGRIERDEWVRQAKKLAKKKS